MYKKKLFELGFKVGYKGFNYLNYLLEIYEEGDKFIALYEKVAERFNTNSKAVQVCLKRTIDMNDEYQNVSTHMFVLNFLFENQIEKEMSITHHLESKDSLKWELVKAMI